MAVGMRMVVTMTVPVGMTVRMLLFFAVPCLLFPVSCLRLLVLRLVVMVSGKEVEVVGSAARAAEQ